MNNDDITPAAQTFLREELRRRYEIENIRRFRELDALDSARVNTLREFLLANVYPPTERRAQIEAAFEHLSVLLRSPGRLRPLLRALAGSLWRLGRKLPAALAAGRGVADAFVRMRDMEKRLVTVVRDMQGDRTATLDRAAMVRAVASFSKTEIESFIRDLTRLLEQLSHTDMLSGMVNVIRRCKDAMDAHAQTYPEAERAGVALALEIVSGALELFRTIPSSEFALITQGVMLIEQDWHDRMCREADDGTS
ncbi:MAG TPA: hypothetical protein ENN65_00985 [Candidatus Hydrogenedentes bacterium]|nr:hypothetical protein [Candidatus Hydrogenedentota bacterium]